MDIYKALSGLIRKCGLGQIIGKAEPVSGGYMHRMYRVVTECGVYAVKHLNPEIMKRPDARANYARAERLERILERSNIPIVPALEFCGSKMQEYDGQSFYIFRWQEGRISDRDNITADMCRAAGGILGRMHATDPRKLEDIRTEPCRIDWRSLAKRARTACPKIADVLNDNIGLLEFAENELNRANTLLPPLSCLSDEDMDPKNVMWHDGMPLVIDLECLDYGNPASHAMQLALQWSGITTCELSTEKMLSFFDGYLEAYDNGFRGYSDIVGIAYTWVYWLEYNIKRALGECADDEEQKLGVAETLRTIDRIRCIKGMTPDIIEALGSLR